MKKLNKQGISLIVLVITIIVMIILAAAIIISLSNNGIIGKANEAVEQTNLKQAQTIATTIWAESQLTKDDPATIKSKIIAAIGGEDVADKYTIEVDENGVTVELKGDDSGNDDGSGSTGDSGEVVEETWVQDGTVVTNTETNKTYNVGDYVNYVATDSDYEGTWQILGAENGELLIVSSTNVKEDYVLGAENSTSTLTDEEKAAAFEEAKKDYVSGAAELDTLCEAYGKGEKASSVNKARSIKIEDIDRISKYDKKTFKMAGLYEEMIGKTLPDEVKAILEIADYGREVTFSWDGTEYPVYSYLNNNVTVSNSLLSSHATFTWYDEENKEWRTVAKSTTANTTATEAIEDDEEEGKVAKITNNMYEYATTEVLTTDNAAYELLIAKDGTNLYYWLASPYVFVSPDCAGFGLRAVYGGDVSGYGLVDSDGGSFVSACGIRAVVSLASDTQLTEADTEGSWEIVTETES